MKGKTLKRRAFHLGVSLFACILAIFMGTMLHSQVCNAKEKNMCGKNAEWEYTQETKTLSIKGTGEIIPDDDWRELEIVNITIGEGITKIGDNAFCNCAKVNKVEIPSTVTEIGNFSFASCKKLKDIKLPTSLKRIGWGAFESCKKLIKIEIPNSVTVIGANAFRNCKALKSVKLSTQMKEISSGMFDSCDNLVAFTIPSNVTDIGYQAFSGSGLESIQIPKTVEKMGEYIFSRCTSLSSVEWYASTVPYGTFYGCTNLKDVKLGKDVNEIGSLAFYKSGLEEYTIPNSVTKLGRDVFGSCNNLTKLTIPGNIKTVPSGIIFGSKNVKQVVLKKGVEKIEKNAFANSYVKKVVLPSTIKTMEEASFINSNIESIVIPDSITKVRDFTFKNCKALKTVTFGKNVKEIGEGAFAGCEKLSKVLIPSNVKKIGYKAFKGAGLKQLVLKDGVNEIDYWAFYQCPNLSTVQIGNRVNCIRANAFLQCPSLVSISVSKENKNYASYDGVLYNKKMTQIICCPVTKSGTFKIPATVSKIYGSAFSKCEKITAFDVDPRSKNYTVEDGIVYNKDKTVLVACPPGKKGKIKVNANVREISDYAFHYSCASSIILPSKLKKIGYCAFEYCSELKSIVIPGNVQELGNAAFWKCPKLKYVQFNKGVTQISDDAFHGCTKLSKIIVPQSVKKISSTAFSGCSYQMVFYVKKSSYAMKYASSKGYYYKLI